MVRNPLGPSDGFQVGDEMRRIMETKRKILKLLSGRSKTLTEISRELELAPSTVSQHLAELKLKGAILHVENTHVRKWKYYIAAPEYSNGMQSGAQLGRNLETSRYFVQANQA